jgi:methionyl-tRNA synthetase
MDTQAYCDEYAQKFEALKSALNLSYTNFIRTTDLKHIDSAQKFWKRCFDNNDIYKKKYQIKYCVGCELEKTDSELESGKCPLHPNKTLEVYEEENYFFRFSKYQQPLLDFYEKNPDFVVPESRFNEIKSFVSSGLNDFSISRLKSKMPWGIDVPDDPEQVMYVWFDALINYISTLNWPDERVFKEFWPGVQMAGKDNLRQQTAMWQAMLMSAGVNNSKQVFIHGFLTKDGQKISKSLGNTVNPIELVNKYGTDAVRYYLLAKVHPWEDCDFTYEKFEEAFNSDLANGLGNLVSRVAKLCETSNFTYKYRVPVDTLWDQVVRLLNEYRFDMAIEKIWERIKDLDRYLEEKRPWENKTNIDDVLNHSVEQILIVVNALKPFLPNSVNVISEHFKESKIGAFPPLFPRIK